MEIRRIIVGPLRTNCYCVVSRGEALIIDPGADPMRIIDLLGDTKLRYIIATHGHFDHVSAVEPLRKRYSSPFLIHREDEETLRIFGSYVLCGSPPRPDRFLEEGDIVRVGDEIFHIIHTPGHTPGSICIYSSSSKVVFTGDTLFRGAFGRTDLPGGDPEKMFDSLRKIFRILTDEYVVYPGHGESTTIGEEKRHYLALLR